MKRLRIGLLGRILVAILLGIGAGYVMPVGCARVFMTFNAVFSQFLGFLIPLIIVGFVVPAIAEIGSRAGRMLAVTALIAYGATLLSGFFSYFTGNWLFPDMITPGAVSEADLSAADIAPYFTVAMPPLFGVMTALILSFLLGLGIAYSGSRVMKGWFEELRVIVSKAIASVIIPFLPVYIFGIFLNMTMLGQVGTVLMTFLSIIAVIFVIHIAVLLIQYGIAGAVAGKNPFRMLWTMLPAYFTALGTQSSQQLFR